MAIPGKQVINIGLQNESTGSDSLFTAFNKSKVNFDSLFANASPFNIFTGNTGISVTANSTAGTIDITNTGVTSIIAGTGVVINQSTGDVTISSTGGGSGSGGTVTSVGIISATLTVTGTPIIDSGNFILNLTPVPSLLPGNYVAPTIIVDQYGRITNAVSSTSVGTVTNIAFTPGAGIQVTGGPVTTTGTINITNTGVTRLQAGSGISLSGSNGNVTISSSSSGGTVTSVGLTSTSLVVSSGTITTVGSLSVDLPTNVVVVGNITAARFNGAATGLTAIPGANVSGAVNLATFAGTANAVAGGNVSGAVNLATYATQANAVAGGNVSGAVGLATFAGTANAVAGGNVSGAVGLATFAGTANAVAGGNVSGAVGLATFAGTANAVAGGNVSGQVSNALISGTVYTNAQPNITSTGTLSSLAVTGNITGGNLITSGRVLFNGGEDLANLAAVSLTTTASYFSTAAAETATLAAGTSGQVKTFMMVVDLGAMVITVTNPGWGGAGTITFTNVGEGCTLQYINSKWFCIGNNNAVFA